MTSEVRTAVGLEVISGEVLWVAKSKSDPGANWTAGKLITPRKSTVKFAGTCTVEAGEKVSLAGKWEQDPSYGRQLRVMFSAPWVVTDRVWLINTLKTRFPGVGEKKAERLIAYAEENDESVEGVLREASEDRGAFRNLMKRIGLNEEQVMFLVSCWSTASAEFRDKSALISAGVPGKCVDAVWRECGTDGLRIAGENPYKFFGLVDKFSFDDADGMAMSLGIDPSDERRIVAAVRWGVTQETVGGGNGHVWTTIEALEERLQNRVGTDGARSLRIIREVAKRAVEESPAFVSLDLPGFGRVVGLRDVMTAEAVTARFLRRNKDRRNPRFSEPIGEEWVRSICGDNDPSPGQIASVVAFSSNKVTTITGAAGTGKTYAISLIVRLCQERKLKLMLAAPTGKAAKRMSELLVRNKSVISDIVPPQTIHRILGYNGQTWIKGPENQLEADVLIIDEVSMVDVYLMKRVIDAMKSRTALVLVGDHNQLPPVGPGAILRDIVSGGLTKIVRLEHVFRSAGPLRLNASMILRGRMRPTTEADDGGVVWLVQDDIGSPESTANAVVSYYEDVLRYLGEARMLDVQVISPIKKGACGVRMLNVRLREVTHTILYGMEPPRDVATIGDRVIQTRNDYEIGLMNGDQGVIRDTAFTDQYGNLADGWLLETDLGGEPRMVRVPKSRTQSFDFSYAITAHRFQGSEAPHVICSCHSTHSALLNRPVLYTMATRPTKTIAFLGDQEGIYGGVRRTRGYWRRTLMANPDDFS